jgi:hypothetical protein
MQDNFKYMQSAVKLLHARKRPTLLLKVDIAHDSVAWSFLFEVLQYLGFPRQWIDWVAALLSIANTKILLNGVPWSGYAMHGVFARGNPLPPMLFLLVMKVLSALIYKVDACSLWQPLGVSALSHGTQLILFISPVHQDLHLARSILCLFEKAS